MVDADHLLQSGWEWHTNRIDLVRHRDLRTQEGSERTCWLGHIFETWWRDHGGASRRRDLVYHARSFPRLDSPAGSTSLASHIPYALATVIIATCERTLDVGH